MGGAKTRPVIAIVRGRQEFGPRALGHRSLLAVPDAEMKDRMCRSSRPLKMDHMLSYSLDFITFHGISWIRLRNRIKFRQWYRPAARMIADEALEEVFGHKYRSAYMEFAPTMRGLP